MRAYVATEPTPWYLTDYKKQFAAKSTERVLPKVEAVASQQMLARNSKRDTVHNHPSELSKNNWCPRASVYKITGQVETDPSHSNLRRMNIFAEGHSIHDKWQKWMWDTGCLVGNWRCNLCGHGWMGKSPLVCPECMRPDIKYLEVPIFDEEHMIIGHADGEWEDSQGRALIEIKSVGLGTIKWDAPELYEAYEKGDLTLDELWKRIKRPLIPHRRQINLYMHCRKIDKAIVLYEWKPSQEVKEFHLSYDAALVKPMLEGAKLVKEAVEQGTLPPRPQGFRKSKECLFCPFKQECWSS